jgi:hypothetical protein
MPAHRWFSNVYIEDVDQASPARSPRREGPDSGDGPVLGRSYWADYRSVRPRVDCRDPAEETTAEERQKRWSDTVEGKEA